MARSPELRPDRKSAMTYKGFPLDFVQPAMPTGVDKMSSSSLSSTEPVPDRWPATAPCRYQLRRKSDDGDDDFRLRRRGGGTAVAAVYRQRTSRTCGNIDFRFIDFRFVVMSVVFLACLQSTVLCFHPGSTGVAAAPTRDASIAFNRSLPAKSYATPDLSGDVINGVRCRVRCLSLLQVNFITHWFSSV